MDSELSKEQLEAFLDEVGIVSTNSATTQLTTKDESLEKLLDEVMGLATPIHHSFEGDQTQLLPKKEKAKRAKFPKISLWLSIAILSSFFLGSLFGFFWGKTQKAVNSTPNPFEEIETKLSHLVSEIKEIYEKVNPNDSPGEIIEPLKEPSNQLEKLAPKAPI